MTNTKPALSQAISIYSDIFECLQKAFGKRNPIAAALGASVCPQVAKWYLANKTPHKILDNVSAALLHASQGGTWETALQEHQLAPYLPFVRRYVNQILPRRAYKPNWDLKAELDWLWARDPQFCAVFGLHHKVQTFAGSWEGILEYTRTIAFLESEWRHNMQIPFGAQYVHKLSRQWVILSIPGVVEDLQYPVWCWEAQAEGLGQTYIGLVEALGRTNELRNALVAESRRADGKAWLGERPLVYTLDPNTGAARRQSTIEQSDTLSTVVDIYTWTSSNPCDLQALHNINICMRGCGYKHLCFQTDLPKDSSNEKKR